MKEMANPAMFRVSEDTCGKYGIRPTREPPRRPPRNPRFIEHDRHPHVQPGVPLNGPAYPSLQRLEDRLSTFKNWPKSMKQKPFDLAEAGFFYMNVGDKTICFHCGVGCKFWEEHDVPWEEHARWSPDCGYLRKQKSEEFIDEFKYKMSVKPKNNQAANVESSEKKVGEEEKNIDNKVLCKVCLDKEIGVVFRPCGHSVCIECAPALKVCHICRTPIEEFIRIFMA